MRLRDTKTAALPVTGPGARWVVLGRTVFALLGFSAVVTEIATLVARGRFVPANFFSFFTIQSNLLAVTSLLLGAFATATGQHPEWLRFFRGAVTLYMTTTILIFVVLLSHLPASELTAVPWDNTVLHYIMPIVMIVDWAALDARTAVPFRRAVLWLAFPLLYLVYSLIRGPIVGWYPYPFMDASLHGYLGVAVTALVIAVVLTGIAAVIAKLPAWTGRRTGSLGR